MFLDELAGTANVHRACRAAGAEHSSFYRLRRRDPAFARSWDEALATGYAVLEAELMAMAMAMAMAMGTGGETDGDEAVRGLRAGVGRLAPRRRKTRPSPAGDRSACRPTARLCRGVA